MISIYVSAFNLKKCEFNYKFALNNFCKIADEVVVSTINDKDRSAQLLHDETIDHNNLKIVLTGLQPDFPGFDGALKNEALQHCEGDVLISMDLDEYIPVSQKSNWEEVADLMLRSNYDCLMVPVVDIYKSMDCCKSIGVKWRMHKKGFERGVVKFARREDGSHSTKLSDSCELIDRDGNLVKSLYLVNPSDAIENKLFCIHEEELPYVIHLGYLNLDRRNKINKEFWGAMWTLEEGSYVKLDSREELDQYKCYKHNLKLI